MKYFIFDREGGNFMEWTMQRPLTRKEIIERFKSMSDDEGLGGGEPIPLKAFNLSMISEIWNVDILPFRA